MARMKGTKDMKARLAGLQLRLDSQLTELLTCTTAAMRKCVEESIADTRRQIAEMLR